MLRSVARRAVTRKRHPPSGAAPGTLMIDQAAPRPRIHLIAYSPDGVEEQDITDASTLRGHLRDGRVAWIDVQGLGDERVLRSIAEAFQMHPLALEAVVNVPHRPKAELFERHALLIARMASLRDGSVVEREQVSMLVGTDFVVTFQERRGDVFDPVRTRIRQGGGALRSSGAEYLAYALLDALIDGYYPILEHFGDRLEALEEELVSSPKPASLHAVHHLRRELLAIRRAIWPLREMLHTLLRDGTRFITQKVQVHLRDCYDHCAQLIDVVETYREVAGGLMDLYLSSVAHRQNEVMKTLTIMASIFIPLTFMAGVYGMNFDNMPELHVWWAYPLLLVSMMAVAFVMMVYFQRKGWMGSGAPGGKARDGRTEES